MFYRKGNLDQVVSEIKKLQDDLRQLDRQRVILQRRLMIKVALFNNRYVNPLARPLSRAQAKNPTALRNIRTGNQRRAGLPPNTPTVRQLREQHGCTWDEAKIMQRRLLADR